MKIFTKRNFLEKFSSWKFSIKIIVPKVSRLYTFW